MQFELVPFRPCPAVRQITGEFRLRPDGITCRWLLEGDIDRIRWPKEDGGRGRRMGLWEHTCFECFVRQSGSAAYLEFNLSPAGHWNSFGFDDLRSGMHETGNLTCRQSSVEFTKTTAVVSAVLDCNVTPPCTVGISAVIEDIDGNLYYFALAHRSGRPDFHLPDNHLLETGFEP